MNVMVVDDEPLLRFHLQRLLQELWEDLEQVVSLGSGIEAVNMIHEVPIHTVFLDIKMPGISGIETAELLRENGYQGHIVFVTAYDEHAVAAFEHEAVDYILKPVEEERLHQCIERIIKRDQKEIRYELNADQLQQLLPSDQASSAPLRWINATKGNRIHIVQLDDIYCFIAEDKYTTVVTAQGEYLIRKTIKQLTQELNGAQFWRIHRAVIVQVAKIAVAERDEQGHYSVTMQDIDRTLPVSRNNTHLFKQM
ncbi:response regulator transcription factor [Maribrevibacterium harenarium]|uniref:Response regulator transcription factor n=1 Tax=Maribrevibacterium harenarium TaxID=2589817 RepID=A0A501WPI8_9GAMM|nr:LytTR family DNA-binding domain-containing protein [Maribrevibacterium harenarium]TPE51258.1 response regulator transcription factor [Maribrevibacterium harenarium]